MTLYKINGNGETIFMEAYNKNEILDRLSVFCPSDIEFNEEDYEITIVNQEDYECSI